MAELMTAGRNGRAVAPRIDLTPMVDLGFLLITFFIMTTTMSKPKAMDIQMPYDSPTHEVTAFYESSAITLMPASNHRIFYYEGRFTPEVQLKETANMNTLRDILIARQKQLQHRAKKEERELQVLIKSHPAATVDDIVGLFDEMSILKVNYFAMVDIYPEEADLVNRQLGLR